MESDEKNIQQNATTNVEDRSISASSLETEAESITECSKMESFKDEHKIPTPILQLLAPSADNFDERRPLAIQELLDTFMDSNNRFVIVNSLVDTASLSDADRLVTACFVIFQRASQIRNLVEEALTKEIQITVDSTVLFRNNSAASRLATLYTKKIAEPSVSPVFLPIIHKIATDDQTSFEIDEIKLSHLESVEANCSNLLNAAQQCVDVITSWNCPPDLKKMYALIKEEVNKKFPGAGRVAVASFVFLRYFNPLIVTPEKSFPDLKCSMKTRRKLVLISKLMQSLANGVEHNEKEEYMKRTGPFIAENLPKVNAFLEDLVNVPSVIGKSSLRKETNEELLESINCVYSILHSHGEKLSELFQRSSKNYYEYDITPNSSTTSTDDQQQPILTKEEKVEAIASKLINLVKELGQPPLYVLNVPETNNNCNEPTNHTHGTLTHSISDVSLNNPPPARRRSSSLLRRSSSASKVTRDAIYEEYLVKSKQEDFSAISACEAIFVAGNDIHKRPVVVIMPDRLPVKSLEMDKLLLYMIHIMDSIVQNEYVLVFCQPSDSGRPAFSWLRNAYSVFDRKYKKNVKELYIVKPGMWLRLLIATFRPFISGKFWRKLKYIDEIKQISSIFPNKELPSKLVSLATNKS